LTMVSRSFAANPSCSNISSSAQRAASTLLPVAWRVVKITERIQFSTQERIAHAVATIEFSPTVTYARPESSSTEVAAVADMVIRMLLLFPRLSSFRCAYLLLQPQHLHTISGMANLRSFHTTNCHLPDQFYDHGHDSLVEEFAMVWQGNTANLLGVTLSHSSHQHWFSFMHLDHLRTLHLAPPDAFLNQMLANIVDRDIKLHALRSLSLPWMAIQSESFVPLLEHTPFLHMNSALLPGLLTGRLP